MKLCACHSVTFHCQVQNLSDANPTHTHSHTQQSEKQDVPERKKGNFKISSGCICLLFCFARFSFVLCVYTFSASGHASLFFSNSLYYAVFPDFSCFLSLCVYLNIFTRISIVAVVVLLLFAFFSLASKS